MKIPEVWAWGARGDGERAELGEAKEAAPLPQISPYTPFTRCSQVTSVVMNGGGLRDGALHLWNLTLSPGARSQNSVAVQDRQLASENWLAWGRPHTLGDQQHPKEAGGAEMPQGGEGSSPRRCAESVLTRLPPPARTSGPRGLHARSEVRGSEGVRAAVQVPEPLQEPVPVPPARGLRDPGQTSSSTLLASGP